MTKHVASNMAVIWLRTSSLVLCWAYGGSLLVYDGPIGLAASAKILWLWYYMRICKLGSLVLVYHKVRVRSRI